MSELVAPNSFGFFSVGRGRKVQRLAGTLPLTAYSGTGSTRVLAPLGRWTRSNGTASSRNISRAAGNFACSASTASLVSRDGERLPGRGLPSDGSSSTLGGLRLGFLGSSFSSFSSWPLGTAGVAQTHHVAPPRLNQEISKAPRKRNAK